MAILAGGFLCNLTPDRRSIIWLQWVSSLMRKFASHNTPRLLKGLPNLVTQHKSSKQRAVVSTTMNSLFKV